MPPRWVSAAILIGWITAVGWLFRLEIWPALEPGSPPPFTIDLVDEAQTDKPIRWQVTQTAADGVTHFVARTSVEHRAKENDFTLRATFDYLGDPDGKRALPRTWHRLRHMDSAYRVTPEGRLLGLQVAMDMEQKVALLPQPLQWSARVWGDVQHGRFTAKYQLDLPGRTLTGALQPVAVSSQGSVVLPLHPLNRISGLKPGQTWRVPVFDPVGDSWAAMAGDEGRVRFLRAIVRPQTASLTWNRIDTPCLVVDYEEEKAFQEERMTGQTWVRAADGLVLRQVADLPDSQWVMDRE